MDSKGITMTKLMISHCNLCIEQISLKYLHLKINNQILVTIYYIVGCNPIKHDVPFL